MKKTTRMIGIVAIALALTMVLSAGVAVASRPVVSTPETENIRTVTILTCVGSVSETEKLSWDSSNMDLQVIPPLDDGEVVGKLTYQQDLVVTAGGTEFSKTFKADTGNTPNLKVVKSFGYAQGLSIGTLNHDEEVRMQIVAETAITEEVLLCPFAAAALDEIPASCEDVAMGSKLVVTKALASTVTEVVMSESPITVHYQVDARGLGGEAGTMAEGTGEAYMSVYAEDGSAYGCLSLGSVLSYEEKAVAIGSFQLFKEMDYKSVIRPKAMPCD